MDVKMALIGGGHIGQGFLKVILQKQEIVEKTHGIHFDLVAVCDSRSGSLLSDKGLPVQEILSILEDGSDLTSYAQSQRTIIKGLDPKAIIELSRADVVVVCVRTENAEGRPAVTHIKEALSRRKNVITSNKWPIALHFDELTAISRENQSKLLFRATVMGSTPVIEILSNPLFSSDITELNGILSVSSNIILDSMEAGLTESEAISSALQHHSLESNHLLDIEGHDTRAKLLILINVLSKTQCSSASIIQEGIDQITAADIKQAAAREKRYRLVANAYLSDDGGWNGEIGAHKLSSDHPFYPVTGSRNVLQIKNRMAGDTWITGMGGGQLETGYALYLDLLSLYT